jgi:hypothetical protein
VDALLATTRRRAVRLALLQAVLALACAALGSLLLAAGAAAALGPWPGRLVLGAVGLSGLAAGGWLLRRSPLTRAALAARDRRELARLVCRGSAAEGAGLDQSILSSVELREAPPGVSTELLALLHQRAAAQAARVVPERALPGSLLRGAGRMLAGLLAVTAAVALVAPKPLQLGLLRLWFGDAATPPLEREPIAGDLSITYLYPAYTGLPPRTEEGTAGDLRAPKGTEVRLSARADRDVEQAFAVYNGAALPLEATGPGRRQLSGTINLRESGRWALRYADRKGRAVAEGPPRPVEVIADQPPVAAISDPVKTEVEVDPLGKLPVSWSAQDDHGLQGVWLVLQRPGSKEERVQLWAPPEAGVAARRASGTYPWQLAPLQLRAGDRVVFRIEALDQDAVDGPQKGASAQHSLKIFSAAEHHREALLRAQQLWERLVLLLANRLEEKPFAPGAQEAEARAWSTARALDDRLGLELAAEIGRVGAELAKDKLAPKALGRALRNVQQQLSPLVLRTQGARAPFLPPATGAATPGLQAPQALEGARRGLAHALSAEVQEEEKDVLYLEDLLDKARLEDLAEVQRELARDRRELARLAEQLRSTKDAAAQKALLDEVARLRDRVQELLQRMAEMAKGIQDEHLNQEAVETVQKEQDLLTQLSEVQKKLQSGDVDAALSQLDALGQQLDKLEKQLQQKGEQRSGENYSEEAKALQKAADELSKLGERETALRQRTAKLRREQQEEAKRRFEKKGGDELKKRLLEKAALARKELERADPKLLEPLGIEDALDAARERTDELERALASSDFEEALDQAQRAERALDQLQGRLAVEDQLRQLGRPAEVRRAQQGVAGAKSPVQQIAKELSEALPQSGRGLTEQQRQELQQQSSEQRQIKEGLGQVREQLAEVGKKVPIFGPQHTQLLEQAQQAMEQAEKRLGKGEPRAGEAGEEQAQQHLEKFEQAMKEMAKKQQGGGGGGLPMPWGDVQREGDGDEGEGSDASREKVEIPDAESSRGPQEFRKRLLDAMKQAPPEKFKDRVRQYYEELVK